MGGGVGRGGGVWGVGAGTTTCHRPSRDHSHPSTTFHPFLPTPSSDGHVKFWKKTAGGVEFAKHFKAHLGPVSALAVSADGARAASASPDGTAKLYDVATFDMTAMLPLGFVPGAMDWAAARGDPAGLLVVADADAPRLAVYDIGAGAGGEGATFHTPTTTPVLALRYNAAADALVIADSKGILDFWRPATASFPSDATSFTLKSDADLYALAKARTTCRCLEVAGDGSKFVAACGDGRVRVFDFATGKLRREGAGRAGVVGWAGRKAAMTGCPRVPLRAGHPCRRAWTPSTTPAHTHAPPRRVYDESPDAAAELQRAGGPAFRLEAIDFGRRLAAERERVADPGALASNAVFDDSGHFLLVPTLLGIKVINLETNRVVRVLGKVESTERFVRVALFQGVPRAGASGADLLVVGALSLFALPFAVNSSLHSYLILAYAGSEKAAEDVGFYYAANASGRLAGILLSGILTQHYGMAGCLWGSAVMLAVCFGITALLPSAAISRRVPA